MKPYCCSFFVASLIFTLVSCATSLTAQSTGSTGGDYVDVIRAERSASADDSIEFLLANLKLTSALWESDLCAARSNARDTLQLAQQHGADAVIVAKLHLSTIESWLKGRSFVEAAIQISDFELSSAASPELQLHFYMTLIEREIWSFNYNPRIKLLFNRLLEFSAAAADQCRDPDLKSRQQAQEFFVRAVWFSEPQSNPRMQALRKSLVSDNQRFPYLTNSMVLDLVNGIAPDGTAQISDRIQSYEKAKANAVISGRRISAAFCDQKIGLLFELQKDLDSALSHYQSFLRESMALGAQPLIYRAYVSLGKIERKRGNSDLALELLSKAEGSAAFKDQPFLQQHFLCKDLLSLHRALGNNTQIKKYEQKVLSTSEVKELRHSQENLDELESLLSLIVDRGQQNLERLRERHRITEEKSQAKIASLKMYLFFASAFSLLLASWLVFLARLKKVSYELDSEKDHVRQSEKERDDLALRLNRIQRMESLGLMAGSIAHDFNNILVGVLGNAEVIQMQNDPQDSSFVRQRVENIITSAEKAASLSRQMLAYAGKQYIAKQSTDLNELILQYEPVLRSACSPNQTLEIELCNSEIVSKVDRTQVEQVVLNLVTNAVQASSGTAPITIRSGVETVLEVEQDSTLYGTRKTGGEFCFIEVQDHGQGISPNDLDRIFEPFYSNSEIGRGLGLSVVYGVAKGHEGLVRCRTEVGRGTTFRVLFPVSTKDAGQSENDPFDRQPGDLQVSDEAAPPDGTVLIIDDEESVLELCQQLLQFSGWNVLTANDGTEGLIQVVERGSEISCLLLDVVMPEMNANELLRELENRGIRIPVVLMSGFSQTKLEFFLQRPNVVAIIEKPFHAIEIQRAVQSAVAHWNQSANPGQFSNSFNRFPEHAK